MDFDAVVIGSGPAGYPCAIRLAQLGKSVAIVEKGNIGGECLNFGCIPSKSLIHSAKIVHDAQISLRDGLLNGSFTVDYSTAFNFRGEAVRKLTAGVEQLLKANGVEIIRGEGRIMGRNRVLAAGREIECSHAVVATGTSFSELPGITYDHETVIDVRDLFNLKEIPSRLLIVGGGYIGVEMGQALARLGSSVTIVEIMDHLLPGVDREISGIIEKTLKGEGVTIYTSSSVTSINRKDRTAEIKGQGTVQFDRLLLSIGKRAETPSLGLDGSGVEIDGKGFIKVDRQCRTAAGWIYAAGDITGPPFLAHRATYMGKVAAESIAGMQSSLDANAIPSAVFTDPEIAVAGLTESEARQRGIEFRVGRFPFSASGRAVTMRDTGGFVKLIFDKDDVLVGCEIIGPDASELVSEVALAIEMGATADDISLTVHPHPTLPEAIMQAAEAAEGRAIDIVVRKKHA